MSAYGRPRALDRATKLLNDAFDGPDGSLLVRSLMTKCAATIAFLAAFTAGLAIAGKPTPLDALRARFPHGVPWKVEIINADGTSRGTIEMLITSDQGSSCLHEMASGVRVEFARMALSPPLPVTSYGVATFDGDKIKIDLTGGLCDAYVLMSGVVASDGSSTGEIHTLGLGGGQDVATYRATVE
jgi:hypothetical protein